MTVRLLRIHTVPAEEEGSTWLQLFFDLVYVAILVELGNRLAGDMTLEGVAEFAVLFIPIWWSWLEFVHYGRLFPTDDIGQRILTVLYMAMMLLMAFNIHDLTATSATSFLVAYGLSKFILALMYARAWALFPDYRVLTSHTALAFTVVGFVWLGITLLAPSDQRLWVAAIVLGVLAPLIMHLFRQITGRSGSPHPPIKHHFTQHRFGELTIIVLGEFFLKLVTSSEGRVLEGPNLFVGLCLLGISVSLWWLYFDHLEHASMTTAGSRVGMWLYGHYPFLAAITAYGVVGNKIFAADPGQPLADEKRLLFTAALAIAVLAYGAIEWASKEKSEPSSRRPQPLVRLGSAAALVALGAWGVSLSAGFLVGLVVAIFLFQVGLDTYARLSTVEAPRTISG